MLEDVFISPIPSSQFSGKSLKSNPLPHSFTRSADKTSPFLIYNYRVYLWVCFSSLLVFVLSASYREFLRISIPAPSLVSQVVTEPISLPLNQGVGATIERGDGPLQPIVVTLLTAAGDLSVNPVSIGTDF